MRDCRRHVFLVFVAMALVVFCGPGAVSASDCDIVNSLVSVPLQESSASKEIMEKWLPSDLLRAGQGKLGAQEYQNILEVLNQVSDPVLFLNKVWKGQESSTVYEKKAAILLLTRHWSYVARFHEASALEKAVQNISLIQLSSYMFDVISFQNRKTLSEDQHFLRLFYELGHSRKYFWEWLRSTNREHELIEVLRRSPANQSFLQMISGLIQPLKEGVASAKGWEKRRLASRLVKLESLERALRDKDADFKVEARSLFARMKDSLYARLVPELVRSEETMTKMLLLVAMTHWGVYGSYTLIADPSKPTIFPIVQTSAPKDLPSRTELTEGEKKWEAGRQELQSISEEYFVQKSIDQTQYQSRLKQLLEHHPELSWE